MGEGDIGSLVRLLSDSIKLYTLLSIISHQIYIFMYNTPLSYVFALVSLDLVEKT